MEIVKLSSYTLKDMNKANEAFEIIGKLKPTFVNDEWAKDKKLYGLALETQDNNLLACRFYSKCGFIIGAVNAMLHDSKDIN